MPKWVNQTAARRARRVCLYDFLLAQHPGNNHKTQLTSQLPGREEEGI